MTDCRPASSGIADLTGTQLVVDLESLANNWKFLQSQFCGEICGATTKANAYGIGIEPVITKLYAAGCRYFFVALPEEGEIVRKLAADAKVIILNGLLPNQAKYYQAFDLIPVLNCEEEFFEWMKTIQDSSSQQPIFIHYDTGINRLGMQLNSLRKIADSFPTEKIKNSLVIMTHLACADEPEHPKNNEQLSRFQEFKTIFPKASASMCNSAGIFLGPEFHFNIARPGIAIYGAKAVAAKSGLTKPIATLYARILQIRSVPVGESIGYGATFSLNRQSRIATIACGYADGFIRMINSQPKKHQPSVYLNGYRAPIIGRISMDQLQADVTGIPESSIQRNSVVELFGEHISVDEVADWAGTIAYEVLTGLGPRVARKFVN